MDQRSKCLTKKLLLHVPHLSMRPIRFSRKTLDGIGHTWMELVRKLKQFEQNHLTDLRKKNKGSLDVRKLMRLLEIMRTTGVCGKEREQ